MFLPPLYVILDTQFAQPPLDFLLDTLSKAGARWVQLRDKRASSKAFFASAREFVPLCHHYSLIAIINDRVDIAMLTDADGIHLGQEDLPVEEARKVLGPVKIIGFSTHNLKQAREAQGSSADYVAIGPVFPTLSKQNPDPLVSGEDLRAVRREVTKPLVAIGGITTDNAGQLFEIGINSVAVIRDLLLADDMAGRVKQYHAIAERKLRKAD